MTGEWYTGGGAKIAAMAGFAQVREQTGIMPDICAGASAGAIMATMRALGIVEQLVPTVLSMQAKQVYSPAIFASSGKLKFWACLVGIIRHRVALSSLEPLRKLLRQHIAQNVWLQRRSMLICYTMDKHLKVPIEHNASNYAQVSDWIDILIDSCSVPGVNLTRIQADGGILTHMPISLFKRYQCNWLGISSADETPLIQAGIIGELRSLLDGLLIDRSNDEEAHLRSLGDVTQRVHIVRLNPANRSTQFDRELMLQSYLRGRSAALKLAMKTT